jgi:predicted branched-subunit amino acid permease
VLYLGWNLATLIGALAGDAIGDVRAWGLDAVAAAAFLALLWPRLTAREPVVIAGVAAAITVVMLPLVPAGIPILVVSVVAIITAVGRHRRDPQTPDVLGGGAA